MIEMLKPCPFCGGEAKVMHMDLDAIEEGWKVWGVWCDDDLHAEDYYSHGHYIDNYATEAEAIKAWNTRAVRTCKNKGIGYRYHFKCSLCGYDALIHNCEVRLDELPSYCPNCGARVKGAGNDD